MKNLTKMPVVAAFLVALALVGAGCDRSDGVQAYNAPKDPPPPAPPVAWTVPPEWKQLPAEGMRYAAYAVSPQHPDAVLTVIPLGPSSLLANVNRWEGQLGLPHSQEKDLDKVVRHLDLPAGHVDMVELQGPEKPGKERDRMLGAIIEQGEQRMWFFKLSGPDSVVSAQKENFEGFIKSVRLNPPNGGAARAHDDASPGESPTPPPASPPPAASAEKPVKWTAPPEWVQDAQPRTMRTLSFQITSGDKKAEVSVIRLPGQNADRVLSYINIWRGDAGLKPVQDVNMGEAKRVTIAGRESLVFDYAGPDGAAEPSKRVVVAMCVRGQDIWFFKLFGDAPVVSAQDDAFQKFITSVEFGG